MTWLALAGEGLHDRVVVGESLDGQDVVPGRLDGERHAREHRPPVDDHGAGATRALVAGDLEAGETQAVTKDVGKGLGAVQVVAHDEPVPAAVDGERQDVSLVCSLHCLPLAVGGTHGVVSPAAPGRCRPPCAARAVVVNHRASRAEVNARATAPRKPLQRSRRRDSRRRPPGRPGGAPSLTGAAALHRQLRPLPSLRSRCRCAAPSAEAASVALYEERPSRQCWPCRSPRSWWSRAHLSIASSSGG